MEAEGGDDESGVTEDNTTPSTSSAGSGSVDVTSEPDRRLQETPVLKAKSSGKKQFAKSELQNKLFEFLDCDLEMDQKDSPTR